LYQSICEIFVAPPATEQLRALPPPLRKVLVKRMQALRTSPRPSGVMKLEGVERLYRIREGDYRIVYTIRERDLLVLAVKNAVHRVIRLRN